ncbi:oligosaccharide flippase family protein [Rossellomorea sp. BNER]|jgi:stage V sporulation protein B|uniref:oligosaccharide flippase family protein n=1 Tax=Rossellomorea sp. BNER TaxID=2962031 RepID=UPI003AF28572|nr:oligosaccharide flippase family protein [Rossellomorea sp. BNER]
MKVFYRGMLLLVVAAFFGECLEFLINMKLAKELGEEGLGIYMSILPSIFLIVIIASLELPISISKFVSERKISHHRSMLQHAMRFTIIMTIALLLIMMVVVNIIPVFHEHQGIKWLILILIPVIAFSSIARGYFMGIHHMGKIATANFLRKIAQLILLSIVYTLFSFTTETSIFIALSTLIASEIVVFLYLMQAYFLYLRKQRGVYSETLHGKDVRKALIAVSFPTTVMRVFHAVTHAIQPFLIKAALVHSGMSVTMSNEHFGLLAGVAMSIGFFPAFISHSLLVVLIPTVSEKVAKKDLNGLHFLLRQVTWITLLYGIPAIFIFYHWGDMLTHMFFESSAATFYLQLLWPYFLFHFFVMPLQAFLIGLGMVKDALYHTIWSTVVSFTTIYLLGSNESFSMVGVILGMNLGAVIITVLHYWTICSKIGFPVLFFKSIKNR